MPPIVGTTVLPLQKIGIKGSLDSLTLKGHSSMIGEQGSGNWYHKVSAIPGTMPLTSHKAGNCEPECRNIHICAIFSACRKKVVGR